MAMLLVGLGASPAPAADPAADVLDDGPVTAFDWTVRDGVPALEVAYEGSTYQPGEVVVRADGGRSGLVLPDVLPPGYDDVAEPGSTVHQLPGTGTAGLPSIGWSTERLGTVTLADGSTAAPRAVLRIAITGPGRVVAFTDAGETGLVRHLDTRRSTTTDIEMPLGTTVSPTWLFGAPGSYEVIAEPTLVLPDGGGVAGAASTYRIEITEPSTPTDPSGDPTAPPTSPPPTSQPPSGSEPPRPDPGGHQEAPVASAPSRAEAGCTVPGLAPDAASVSEGHFDYGVQVRGSTLDSRIKDDQTSPPMWRAPDSLLFLLGQTARQEVPSTPAFGFLGAAGDPVWTIGQTQQSGVPWLGWNTQHPSAVSGIAGPTTWRLDAVDGPGELFVYQTGAFGRVARLMGIAQGWPRSMSIAPNTHGHGNWSFTAPGVYRVTTTHRATLTSGTEVSSTRTLFFQVGSCGDGSTKPSAPLDDRALLADRRLRSGNRGGVVATPIDVEPGDRISLAVPSREPGAWLMPVAYSTPKQLGWRQVTPTRQLTEVRIPRALEQGRHKVAVYDDAGLVGWAPVRVGAAAPPEQDPEEDEGNPDSDPAPDRSTGLTGTPLTTQETCLPTNSETAPGSGDSESDAARTAVSSGHFDFGAQIQGDQLVARIKDDRAQPPAWVDPASLLLVLGAGAEQEVPDGAAYGFLGSAGDPIWLMPQTQVGDLPWLGWNTQDPSLRENVRGQVRFTLDSVSGPGRLAVYLTDSFGGVGEKVVGNVPGFPSSFEVPLNVHAHGNWAFTAPGTYAVTMSQSATLSSGRTVSDQATLHFQVGSGNARTAVPGLSRDASAPALALAAPAVSLVADDNTTNDTADGAEDTEVREDTEDTEASDADTCALPNTGADEHLAQLLQLGLSSCALGAFVLVVARRRTPRRAAGV